MSVALFAVPVWAQGYASYPAAQRLVDELVAEENFSRTELEVLLGKAQRQDSILEAISRPAEKTKPWHEYRDIFVTSARTSQGVTFYNNHSDSLRRAEQEYGVPAELIVAIIGVETRYGRNMGNYRVLDALATLAFDYPRRSAFFSKELKEFLLLSREQGLPATEFKGSYAGAMGYGQFISSSYRNYAVDFDGDGVADIWKNPVDAIGSVANYFFRHDWRSGETVASPAQAETGYRQELTNAGLKPVLTVADFIAAKIIPARVLPTDAMATAMEFEGKSGTELWLGLHNFYVITRYNHSAMYAMSVYQLSQEILARLP
ncbi:MAG: lytic murein transglycosylase B [Halieaceae bacterium]|nr:lytic murein transglycosylase B [Halieaceae bacterium]